MYIIICIIIYKTCIIYIHLFLNINTWTVFISFLYTSVNILDKRNRFANIFKKLNDIIKWTSITIRSGWYFTWFLIIFSQNVCYFSFIIFLMNCNSNWITIGKQDGKNPYLGAILITHLRISTILNRFN